MNPSRLAFMCSNNGSTRCSRLAARISAGRPTRVPPATMRLCVTTTCSPFMSSRPLSARVRRTSRSSSSSHRGSAEAALGATAAAAGRAGAAVAVGTVAGATPDCVQPIRLHANSAAKSRIREWLGMGSTARRYQVPRARGSPRDGASACPAAHRHDAARGAGQGAEHGAVTAEHDRTLCRSLAEAPRSGAG